MGFIFWATLWYVSGLIGCVLGCSVDIKNGEGFKLTDLFKVLLFSATGPIILAIGIQHFTGWRFSNLTIIKGRK